MAANILNSRRAVQMSIFVVRAFAKMREALVATPDLARKLAALENGACWATATWTVGPAR